MNKEILYLMAMSGVLPAAAGLYRYNNISQKFRPFTYMLLLDVLIETLIYLQFKWRLFGNYPLLALNLYMLLNFGLFLALVYKNNYLSQKSTRWLMGLGLATGLFNWWYNGGIFSTFFYLLCFVSAVMMVISIDILSRQVMAIKERLVNNFWFWFSSFSIVYNALNLLIFGLYFFTMFDTPNGKAIANIQHFVNVACNIFFVVAIVKIPSKREQGFK